MSLTRLTASLATALRASGLEGHTSPLTAEYTNRRKHTITTLNTYPEKYDGSTTKIDIDLNGLVDQTVQFFLLVANNSNSQGDIAMWFAPRITH